MPDQTETKSGYAEAQIIRSLIEHENNLQNYRLTWLMTIQGLLFAALGFAWDKQDARGLVSIFCILGILVSLSTWSALKLTTNAFQDLHAWWDTNKPENYEGPPVIGHRVTSSNFKRVFWLLRPWRVLPWGFAASWLIALIFNLSRVKQVNGREAETVAFLKALCGKF